MRLVSYVSAVLVAGVLALFVSFRHGFPTPYGYVSPYWTAEDGLPMCGYRVPADERGPTRPATTFWPGFGDDLISLNGPESFKLFDVGSGQTVARHDTLVIGGAPPSGYIFDRVGPHLVICQKGEILQVSIERHYCTLQNSDADNQIEEITFLQGRETWVSDEIYNALSEDDEFPSYAFLRRVVDDPRNSATDATIRAALEKWRVRPFSAVLPYAFWASVDCEQPVPPGHGTGRNG